MGGCILLHNCNSHLLSAKFDDYVNIDGVNSIGTTKNRINWFCCSNDGGSSYIFDITREKMIYYDKSHSGPANECTFNPMYSSLIVSAGLDKKIFVHDINRKKIGIKITAQSPLSCIQYLPESERHLLCGGTNGDIYLYDLRKFEEPLQTLSTSSCVLGLDIHPSLNFASIEMAIKEKKESVLKANQNKLNRNMTPISSAVSQLPPMEYMSQRFGKIDFKQEMKFDQIAVEETDVSHSIVPNDNETNSNDNESVLLDTASLVEEVHDISEGNLEDKIRRIVREEVNKSETRVLLEMNSKFEQLHSDLLDQFITNEISAEKNMEKIFQ